MNKTALFSSLLFILHPFSASGLSGRLGAGLGGRIGRPGARSFGVGGLRQAGHFLLLAGREQGLHFLVLLFSIKAVSWVRSAVIFGP